MGARAVNGVLGIWLFASSFLWKHNQGQLHNAWIVGVIAVLAALSGLSGTRWARYVNIVLGVWLILSTLFLPPVQTATLLNHSLVGFGLLIFGLIPASHGPPSTA